MDVGGVGVSQSERRRLTRTRRDSAEDNAAREDALHQPPQLTPRILLRRERNKS